MSKATRVVVDGVSYPLDDTTAVDFSEAQSLSAAEKQQARTNIGAGSAADVTSIQTAIGTVPSGSNLQGEVDDLKSAYDKSTYSLSSAENMLSDDMSNAITGKRFNVANGSFINDESFEYKIFNYLGGEVVMQRNTVASGNGGIVFFSESMSRLGGIAWQIPLTLTVPQNTKYIGISTVISDASSVVVTQTLPLCELGNGASLVTVASKNRNGSNGNPSNTDCIAINKNGYIDCKTRNILIKADMTLQSGYSFRLVYYLTNDSSNFVGTMYESYFKDQTIIDTQGYKYVSLQLWRASDSDHSVYDPIRVETVGYYCFKAIYLYDNYEIKQRLDTIDDKLYKIDGLQPKIVTPVFLTGSVGNPGNAAIISTQDIIPWNYAENATIYVNPIDNNDYYITITTYSVKSGKARDNAAYIVNKDIDCKVTNGCFVFHKDQFRSDPLGFAFNIKKQDSSGNLVAIHVGDDDAIACVVYGEPNPTNYVLDTTLLKRTLNVRQWGYCPKTQAFIVNNGYIYSIAQDGITKSALSDPYTVISSSAIQAGHANNLQLAPSGYAYASGWDDSTLYQIDLSDLTISRTYTLPVTGYFTAVYDDMKEKIYIFHQPTLTTGYYFFSVYDTITETIESTKTVIAFDNIQAVDLFDDRIIVMAGLAEPQSPNKMFVFDTSGNVLCNYYLGSITAEYEGVCVDRDTHRMYISDIGQRMYIVEA